MDAKYKDDMKELPVADYILYLKQQEILEAARKTGHDFGAKLPKKALAERLAQVYVFFPKQARKCLSGDAISALDALKAGDCEASAGLPGISELAGMGMVRVFRGEDGGLIAVISRAFLEAVTKE